VVLLCSRLHDNHLPEVEATVQIFLSVLGAANARRGTVLCEIAQEMATFQTFISTTVSLHINPLDLCTLIHWYHQIDGITFAGVPLWTCEE